MDRKKWHKEVYSPSETYDKEAWAELRARVIRRDKYKCRRCRMKSQTTIGLSVHHIFPRSKGGSDKMNNLITLCHKCHDFVEYHEIRNIEDIEDRPEKKRYQLPDRMNYSTTDDVERPTWHAWVYGGVKRKRVTNKRKRKTT